MEKAFKKDVLKESLFNLFNEISNESSMLNTFSNNTLDYLLQIKQDFDSENLIKKMTLTLKNNENNLIKIEALIGEINEIIESIYFEIELILNDKFENQFKNYFEKINFIKIRIADFYEFKSKNNKFSDKHLEYEINELLIEIEEFESEIKKSYNALIKVLRDLKSDLKKSFSQNQIIINEQFKVFLNKELENANKILNNEKLTITNGLKHEVRNILYNVESQKNKIISDFDSEKESVDNFIKVANDEIHKLKTGFEKIKEDSFNLKKEISNYSNNVNNLVGLKTQELNENLQGHVESLKSDLNLKIKEINDSYENAKKNYQNFSALAERAGIYGLTQNYAKKAKEEKLEYQNYRKYS